MIVSDQDGFRQRLGNRLAEVVGQGEDDLEPLLFGVMLTVTGNPHGGLHLPVPPCTGFGMVLKCPLLDLLSVEDDHSLGLVLPPSLFILRMLRLFAAGPFPLPADAILANSDLTSFLRLDLLMLPIRLRARLLGTQRGSLLSSLQGRRFLLLQLHCACADKHGVHLERIRRRLRGRFGPELGFADGMLGEMDFCHPKRKMRKPELEPDLRLNSGSGVGRTDF